MPARTHNSRRATSCVGIHQPAANACERARPDILCVINRHARTLRLPNRLSDFGSEDEGANGPLWAVRAF